jgi:trimeric autotransporter adhesin
MPGWGSKTMRYINRCLACVLSVTMVLPPSWAQAPVVPTGPALAADSGLATYDMSNFSGGVSFNGAFFDLRYQAMDGLGYEGGFMQIGGMLPIWLGDDTLVAPIARLIVTNDWNSGVNGGALARRYVADWDRIVGVNAFYDNDNSVNDYRYDQVGFGFETLGQNWDFRFNAYVPTSDDTNFVREAGLTNQLLFFGNRLGFLGQDEVEQALEGYDFEFGVPVGAPWLRAYAGMYQYDQDQGTDPHGIRGRLEGWISDDTSLGVMVSYDDVNHAFVNAVVDWRFSGWRPTRYFPNWTTRERMLMPVQRNWRINTGTFLEDVGVAATNPRDDQPYFVVWVDNSNTNAGDGTFENPYNTLPLLPPEQTDLVLVRRGDTTAAAPLSGSVRLPDYARMLGEGRAHVVDARASYAGLNVSVDNALLPDEGFRDTGLYPFLTSNNNIILANSHNEVSALVLQNAGGAAIRGFGSNGFHFNHLEITNNSQGGIVLTGASGQGPVTLDGQIINGGLITNINRNVVDGWSNPTGLGNNGANGGISIDSGLGRLDVTISQTAMNADPGLQEYGIRIRSTGFGVNAFLDDVQTSGGNNVAGVSLEQVNGRMNGFLNNLTSNNNNGIGLQLLGNGGDLGLLATNVQANGNQGDNVNVTTVNGTTFVGSISNSQFSDSAGGNGFILNAQGGANQLTLSNITANNNAQAGFLLQGDTTGIALSATGLIANSNVGDNFGIVTTGSAVTGTVQNSQFLNSINGTGFSSSTTNGVSNLSLSGVNASNNFSRGVNLFADEATSILAISSVLANANIGDNFGITAVNGSNVQASAAASQFNGSITGNGIVLDATDSVTALGLTGVQANNNNQVGLQVLGNNAQITVNANNLAASDNGGDNVNILTDSGSTFTGNITNAQLNRSGSGAGLVLDTSNGTSTLGLTTVTASDNFTQGIRVVGNNATIGLTGVDVIANNNQLDNLQAVLSGTNFTGTILGGEFNDSQLGSGVVFNASGGTGQFTLTNISASNNAEYGVQAIAVGGAQIGTVPQPPFDGVSVIDSVLNGNGLDATNTIVGGGSYLEFFVDPTSATGSGRHGYRFEVTGSSQLVAAFLDTDLSNSGVDPAALETAGPGGRGRAVFGLVDGAGSTANVTLTRVNMNGAADDGIYVQGENGAVANIGVLNSTLLDAGQAVGNASSIDLVSTSGAQVILTASGTPGTFTGANDDLGLSATSTGANSTVSATIVGGDLSNAGVNAVAAVALSGGTTNITLQDTNGTDAGADAVFANADGGTINLELNNGDFSRAAGNGLNAAAVGGGTFNACLEDIAFDDNDLAGLRLTSAGVGSSMTMQFEDSTANSNEREGLVATATGGAELNIRTLGSNFDNNGTFGVQDFDGVFVSGAGAGTTVRTLFNTTTSDNNSRNGFNFEASTGAFMTARIDSVSSQNNGAFGVRLNATDAGTNAFLLPTGTNTVLNNGIGAYQINYTGTDTSIVQLFGSFNGLAGDGVSVNINNVANALVSLTGNGSDTISSNAGDGVDVRISNADNAGFRMTGYSQVSSNANDGIFLDFSNIAVATAVEILGPTVLSNNGDDGVDIRLTNAAVGGLVLPPGIANLSVLTLTDNSPFNACLPIAVDVPFNQFGVIPAANGILIDQLAVSRVGGPAAVGRDGISIVGTNVTGTGGIIITDSSATNYHTGIGVDLTNGTGTTFLTVDGATVNNSVTDGIRLNLVGTSGTPDLAVTNSSVSNSGGRGIAVISPGSGDVDLSGNSVSNSLGGSGILANLTGPVSSITADDVTISDSSANGLDLVLNGVTGLPNIDLSNVSITNSAQRGLSLVGNAASLGNILLDNVNVQNSTAAGGVGVILSNGSVGSITMDDLTVGNSGLNGINVQLTNQAANGPIAITGPGSVSNSGGNGIQVLLNGTAGNPDISVDGYTVANSAGRGVLITNGTGPGVGQVNVSNTSITTSVGGEGLLIDLDGAVAGVSVTGVSTTASGGTGTQVALNNVTGGGDVTLSNVSATGSAGSGIAVDITSSVVGNVTMAGVNATNSTGGDGIRIAGTNSTITAAGVGQASVSNSSGNGINIDLNTVTGLTAAGVVGPGTVQASGGDGIRLILNNVTGTSITGVAGYQVDGSLGRGINVQAINSPVASATIDSNTVSNSGNDGVFLSLNAAAGAINVSNTSVTNSGAEGIDILLNGVTGTPAVTLSNLSATNSALGGVQFVSLGSALGNITGANIAATNSVGGDGILFSLQGGSAGGLDLQGLSAAQSGGNGISIDLDNLALGGNVSLTNGGTIVDSDLNGLVVSLANVTGTPDVQVVGFDVTNSGLGGIVVANNGSDVGLVNVSSNNVDTSLGGDGIFVGLSNGVGEVTMDSNIVNLSAANGINIALSNVSGSPNITTSNSTVTNSGLIGINLTAVNSLLGNVLLDPILVQNSLGGDGVFVGLTNTSVNSVVLDALTVENSFANGINVQLDTVSVVSELAITANGGPGSVSNSGGTGILVNLVNTNTSTPTIAITDYNVDTSGERGIALFNNGSPVGTVNISDNTVSNSNGGSGIYANLVGPVGDMTFDNNVITASNANGLDILLTNVTGGSDLTVSNTTIDGSGGSGVSILSGNSVLGDVTLDTVAVANSTGGDGVSVILNGGSAGNVNLAEVSADNSNGNGIGVQLVNTTLSGDVSLTGPGLVRNSGLDGILVNLVNVGGTPAVTVDGYGVETSSGRGIVVDNNGSSIGNVNVSNNTVSQSGSGDGISLTLNNLVGDLTLDTNTVSNSAGNGIGVVLGNISGNPDVTISNSLISNSGLNGLLLQTTGSLLGDVLIQNVSTLNSTGGDGVLVDLFNTSVNTLVLNGMAVDQSANNGINLQLDTVSVVTNVAITGPGSVTNSGLDGILVNLTNTLTSTPSLAITDYNVDNSGGRGIAVFNNLSPIGTVSISNNTVSDSTGGSGILADLSGVVGDITMDGNTVTNSLDNGIDLLLTNVVGGPDVTISNSSATTSGDRGVSIVSGGSALGNVTLTDVTATDSAGGDGVAVFLQNGSVGNVDLTRVATTNSGNLGIGIQLTNMAMSGDISVAGPANIATSANDGLLINLNGVTGAPAISISDYNVNTSGGNGIRILNNGSDVGAVAISNVIVADSNGGDGILIDLDNANVGSVAITEANVDNSTGTGINVQLDTVNIAGDVTINGPGAVGNSLGGDGILVSLTGVTGTPNILVDDFDVSDSALRGIAIENNGSPVGTVTVSNNTVENSQGGNGIDVLLGGAATAITVDDNQVVASAGDGVLVQLTNLAGTPNLTVTDNAIGANTGHGVNIDLDNAALNQVDIGNNLIGVVPGFGTLVPLNDALPVIRAGFNGNTLAPNDDGSTAVVNPGFSLNFFGQVFNTLFVNNNGNITFNNPLGTFTPFPIVNNGIPMIAPFFADVDTRNHGQPVTFGTGTISGRPAFGVNWVDVDYFSSNVAHGTQLNDFQLVLVDRSDIAVGDFDMEFNYGTIQWETGNASGGVNGLGGSSARVGFTNGVDTSIEFAGSAVNGALLDSGPSGTSLVQNRLVSANLGRYIFFARNGGFNSSAGNSLDGVHIEQVNSDIAEFSITGNDISNNGNHGVNFATVTNSNIVSGVNSLTITNNTINSNGQAAGAGNGDGIRLLNPDVNNPTLNMSFVGNEITENDGTGLNLDLAAQVTQFNLISARNDVSTNTGSGIRIDFEDPAAGRSLTAGFTNDRVSGNTGGEGVAILVDSNTATAVSVQSDNATANSFSGNNNSDFSGNLSAGLLITATDTATLNLGIGGNGTQNTFDGNGNAGVAVDLSGSTVSTMTVSNAAFTDSVDPAVDTLPQFEGDGFSINLTDSALLANSTFGDATLDNTNFNDNARHGLFINAQGLSNNVNNITVQNFTATGNDVDGLNFNRLNNSGISNVAISGGTITGNTSDGIQISAAGQDAADTYTITDTTINQNTGNGINVLLQADADVVLSVADSSLSQNGIDGVQVRTIAAITDSPSFTGTFTNNEITLNTGDGIDVIAPHTLTIGGPAVADGNNISNNTGHGVVITGPTIGLDLIQNNTINDNGLTGVSVLSGGTNVQISDNDILRSGSDGVRLAYTGAAGAATITNNDIRFSEGDGIEVSVNTTGLLANNVTIGANNITDGQRRGINVLNLAADGDATTSATSGTNLTVNNNAIERNDFEAIYVVNTNGNGQTADANANVALVQGANSWLDDPRLALNVTNNTVSGNGEIVNPGVLIGGGTQTASGLVIRVGTTDAETGDAGSQNNGGFASSFTSAGLAGGATVAGMTRGGVAANVFNNAFSGQFGADATFQSSVTTAPPTVSGGAWTDQNTAVRDETDNVFQLDSFVQDPLARLDLRFTANSGDGLVATRSDANTTLFNNDEPVFKSRTVGQDTATDAPIGGLFDDFGPFTTGGRGRNATRQAARGGAFAAPVNVPFPVGDGTAASNAFLYSGVGASTFRISTDTTSAGFTNVPIGTTFGDGIAIGGATGELPFVWGTLP